MERPSYYSFHHLLHCSHMKLMLIICLFQTSTQFPGMSKILGCTVIWHIAWSVIHKLVGLFWLFPSGIGPCTCHWKIQTVLLVPTDLGCFGKRLWTSFLLLFYLYSVHWTNCNYTVFISQAVPWTWPGHFWNLWQGISTAGYHCWLLMLLVITWLPVCCWTWQGFRWTPCPHFRLRASHQDMPLIASRAGYCYISHAEQNSEISFQSLAHLTCFFVKISQKFREKKKIAV